MRFSIIAITTSLFSLRALAIPASQLHDLFSSPDIPIIDKLEPSAFNLTLPATHSNGGPSKDKRGVNINYLLYTITMDGRNQNNYQNFLVSGSLLVTQGLPSAGTQNGPNPYDILISIGAPATNPIAGSLRYATNRFLYRYINGTAAASLLDFAYVSVVGGSTVAVAVDTRIAAANPLGSFNARTGLLANVFEVAGGGLRFVLASALTGQVGLVGTGYIFGGEAPYNARLSGTVVGRGSIIV